MRNAVIGLLALGLVAGCASTTASCPQAQSGAPPEHLAVRAPGNFEEVSLQCGRMFSPNIEVSRYDDAYRGQAFRKTIDLTIKGDVIQGIVGSARTELRIAKHPDGFELQGLYAGKLGNLAYRKDRLDGKLGGRAFANTPMLVAGAPAPSGTAEGNQAPGGTSSSSTPGGASMTGTTIELPASFASLPPEHQAVMLAIFLGR